MEFKLSALWAAAFFQLLLKAFRAYTNTHRRKLKGSLKNRVPYKDISVKSAVAVAAFCNPVIIVWSTSVVNCTVIKLATDTCNKYSTVFFSNLIFALFWCQFRIESLQIICIKNLDILWKNWFKLRIAVIKEELCALNTAVNLLYNFMKIENGAVFWIDCHFPVPLVYIYRMNCIKFFVRAEGIHICINTKAWFKSE